jgi:hypothetical protein
MDQARDMDPERGQTRELIEHWSEYLRLDQSYSARDIIDIATAREGCDDYAYPEFRDLLLVRCGVGERIEPRRLGNWLMSIRGQVHNGYRIELVHESKRHGNRYRLVNLQRQQRLEGI